MSVKEIITLAGIIPARTETNIGDHQVISNFRQIKLYTDYQR